MDDVIIVGAGPAGNNAALGLTSRGYAVTVIDSKSNVGDKLCTGIISQECIRRFPIRGASVYREARSAQVILPCGGDVRIETATPQARIVDRVAYVAAFGQRAQQAGAKYILGQRVHRVTQEPDGVTVITERDRYRARALVLAAGFGSPLTRQLGLGSVPDHVTAVQASVDSSNSTSNSKGIEVYLGRHIAPGFFAWLVPTTDGQALAGLLTRRTAQVYFNDFLQRLRQENRITRVASGPGIWGIPLRPLKRTHLDRVLVVGDAAGQVKPTTGGGIYYALLSSELAAQTLGEALDSDDLSAHALSRYQHRWRNLLSRELDVGYSARKLFELLSDQQISSLVTQAIKNGIQAELTNPADGAFDWKILRHPVLGGALRLVNPFLARLSRQHEAAAYLEQTGRGLQDYPANVPG